MLARRGGPSGVVVIRESGRDAGVRPIDVAGEEGVLSKAPDGAFTVIARAGSCALVVLVADTERLVRQAVPMLQPA